MSILILVILILVNLLSALLLYLISVLLCLISVLCANKINFNKNFHGSDDNSIITGNDYSFIVVKATASEENMEVVFSDYIYKPVVKTDNVIVSLNNNKRLHITARRKFADESRRAYYALDNCPIKAIERTLVAHRAQLGLSMEEIHKVDCMLRETKHGNRGFIYESWLGYVIK